MKDMLTDTNVEYLKQHVKGLSYYLYGTIIQIFLKQ